MPDTRSRISTPPAITGRPGAVMSAGPATFVPAVWVFVAALTFYVFTLAPTVVWGDSAWLSLQAYGGSIDFGTAGNHPLFVLVGRLFTWLPGEPARNVNLASAVFGSLTVALVYQTGRLLGARPLAALVGAAALCVSHAFWLHSVTAEVYSANACFLVATIATLLWWRQRPQRSRLAAAAAVFMAGLANHLVLITAAPAMATFVLLGSGRALFTRRALAWAMTCAAVLMLLVLSYRTAVTDVLWRLWVGPPSISEYVDLRISPGPFVREVGYYVLFFLYQFPSIALPLGAIGAWTLWTESRHAAVLLGLAVLVNAFVFLQHTDWIGFGSAKVVFYIADYAVFSTACAVGAERVLRASDVRRSQARLAFLVLACVAILPPVIYASMPAVTSALSIDLVSARSLPYRHASAYFLNPSKRGEDGARRFALEALDSAAPNAVIFADFTPCSVLKYVQVVERRRRDVLLCGEEFAEKVPVKWMYLDGRRRPTYVVSNDGYYDFGGLEGPFDLVSVGPLYEVRPR